MSFDVDRFVEECRDARNDSESPLAVKEVLERAMSAPDAVADALPANRAEIVRLHVAPDLTVLKVVWGPEMSIRPHNHLMWAAIGLYGGQEDNTLYRRSGDGLMVSGVRELRTGDVSFFGDDTIHKVVNPLRTFTGAIHVYGGDLTNQQGRSEWDGNDDVEVPFDFSGTLRYFEEANRAASRQ